MTLGAGMVGGHVTLAIWQTHGRRMADAWVPHGGGSRDPTLDRSHELVPHGSRMGATWEPHGSSMMS